MLPGLLEVVEEGFADIDMAALLEVAGEFAEDQAVEGPVVVDALDLGLHQAVEVAHRGVQVHRRVEQQHTLVVEAAAGFIEMADEGRLQCAEAVAGQVEVGDFQVGVLRTHGLHDPVEVVGVVGGEARRGIARGGCHEVPAGRRGQLHHVEAVAVEQLLEVFRRAAGVGRAGAGDDEDERRRVILPGQAVAQLLHRPEVVGQLELALRAQLQGVILLTDVAVQRQLGAQFRRRAGDGRLEWIGQRIAVAGRVDVAGQRGTGESECQAAEQGSHTGKT
ncbi:hypothetical protein D9M71_254600 [compost metagenome]